jgi:hypothetical protein
MDENIHDFCQVFFAHIYPMEYPQIFQFLFFSKFGEFFQKTSLGLSYFLL